MEEACDSVMCPNCILKRRLFLEHAIKNEFHPFKMKVIYKREKLIGDINESSLTQEKYAYNLNCLDRIINEINEPNDSLIISSIHKEMEYTNKLLTKEKELSIKYSNQLDLLYDLLEHDEYLLFNNENSDDEDNDNEDNEDEEYEDNERIEVRSETPTEVERM